METTTKINFSNSQIGEMAETLKEMTQSSIIMKGEENKYVINSIKNAKCAKDLQDIIEGNALASYFTICFNNYLGKRALCPIPMCIMEVKENSSTPRKPIKGGKDQAVKNDYLEAFIVQKYIEGSYFKFNNNYGAVLSSVCEVNDIAQAFSHFTYEFSLGSLIMVDIRCIAPRNDLLFILHFIKDILKKLIMERLGS